MINELLAQSSSIPADVTAIVDLIISYSNAVTAYVTDFVHAILPVIIYGSIFKIVLNKS